MADMQYNIFLYFEIIKSSDVKVNYSIKIIQRFLDRLDMGLTIFEHIEKHILLKV